MFAFGFVVLVLAALMGEFEGMYTDSSPVIHISKEIRMYTALQNPAGKY